jgi:hypothetical protein
MPETWTLDKMQDTVLSEEEEEEEEDVRTKTQSVLIRDIKRIS